MQFSGDDQYLLSCSRDRQWCLFKRTESDGFNFELFKTFKDAHTRIIWGVSWSHEDNLFATCSREKQKGVKIWHGVGDQTPQENIGAPHSELPVNEVQASTAVKFFPSMVRGSYNLMVGLETGQLMIWRLNDDKTWAKIKEFDPFYSHSLSVKRIQFNLRFSEPDDNQYTVATCSSDQSVRIFKITL